MCLRYQTKLRKNINYMLIFRTSLLESLSLKQKYPGTFKSNSVSTYLSSYPDMQRDHLTMKRSTNINRIYSLLKTTYPTTNFTFSSVMVLFADRMSSVRDEARNFGCPGLYFFYAANGKLLYVGMAESDVGQRILTYFRPSNINNRRTVVFLRYIRSYGFIGMKVLIVGLPLDTEGSFVAGIETLVISKHKPVCNVLLNARIPYIDGINHTHEFGALTDLQKRLIREKTGKRVYVYHYDGTNYIFLHRFVSITYARTILNAHNTHIQSIIDSKELLYGYYTLSNTPIPNSIQDKQSITQFSTQLLVKRSVHELTGGGHKLVIGICIDNLSSSKL